MNDTTNATVGGEGLGTETVINESNQEGQTTQTEGQSKIFTQEEVNNLLQSETDKRVNEALEKQEQKFNSMIDEKVKNATDEASRLAKMTTEERGKAKFDKEVEKFETERKQYQSEMMKFETSKELANRELPIDFAEMLSADSADKTKTNIETFEKAFWEAVQTETEKRLKGKTPALGVIPTSKVSTEQFNKMSYQDRVNLYNTNKSEYDRLTGGNK